VTKRIEIKLQIRTGTSETISLLTKPSWRLSPTTTQHNKSVEHSNSPSSFVKKNRIFDKFTLVLLTIRCYICDLSRAGADHLRTPILIRGRGTKLKGLRVVVSELFIYTYSSAICHQQVIYSTEDGIVLVT